MPMIGKGRYVHGVSMDMEVLRKGEGMGDACSTPITGCFKLASSSGPLLSAHHLELSTQESFSIPICLLSSHRNAIYVVLW